MNVILSDPHPGLMGCTEPLPSHMKTTVDWLDGQTMELDEVTEVFENALKDAGIEDGEIRVHDNCIGLLVKGEKGIYYCWRLIRFQEN